MVCFQIDTLGKVALKVLNTKRDLILSTDSTMLGDRVKRSLLENVETQISGLNESLKKDLVI